LRTHHTRFALIALGGNSSAWSVLRTMMLTSTVMPICSGVASARPMRTR
jgi:hypothetical protein